MNEYNKELQRLGKQSYYTVLEMIDHIIRRYGDGEEIKITEIEDIGEP